MLSQIIIESIEKNSINYYWLYHHHPKPQKKTSMFVWIWVKLFSFIQFWLPTKFNCHHSSNIEFFFHIIQLSNYHHHCHNNLDVRTLVSIDFDNFFLFFDNQNSSHNYDVDEMECVNMNFISFIVDLWIILFITC